MGEKGFSWERGCLGFVIFGDNASFELFVALLKGLLERLGESERENARLQFDNAFNRVLKEDFLKDQIDALKELFGGDKQS